MRYSIKNCEAQKIDGYLRKARFSLKLKIYKRNLILYITKVHNKSLNKIKNYKMTERKYINYLAIDLEEHFKNNINNVQILHELMFELGYRKRKLAVKLRKEVNEAIIKNQENNYFKWPNTIITEIRKQLNNMPIDDDNGLLKFYGYSVGNNGINHDDRKEILSFIFNEDIAKVNNSSYMDEWGNKKTAKRLKKMAYCIATFVKNAKRRINANMQNAINDWEKDLAYLKKEFYNNKYSFGWPKY